MLKSVPEIRIEKQRFPQFALVKCWAGRGLLNRVVVRIDRKSARPHSFGFQVLLLRPALFADQSNKSARADVFGC